jgi:DNA-binding response OmpR family regulator
VALSTIGRRAAPESRIWIVSADQWPRAYLRAELIERGYDAVGFVTMKDALLRLMLVRSRRPALLVLDLHGQEINEEMRATLFREHVPSLIIADIGHREDECLGPVVYTLRRPVTIGAIAEAVDRLMGRAAWGAQSFM